MAATTAKAANTAKTAKDWSRFQVSICSYKKQPVKKIWDRILGLVWLKFVVASLEKALLLICVKGRKSVEH